MKFQLAMTLLLLAFFVVFSVQNAAMVDIKLMLWTLSMPRSVLLLITLFVGVLIGWCTRAAYRLTRY